MSKKTKQDLLSMLEGLADEKLQPPNFDDVLKLSLSLKDEHIDTSDLQSMEVDAFDEDGSEVRITVDNAVISNVVKEVDRLHDRLEETSSMLEQHITGLWNQASDEAWYWVNELEKGLDWSTQEWMDSAFTHGTGTLSHWIQGVVRNGDLSQGPEMWIQEYQESAREHRERLNWGVWSQALASHIYLMKDEQATAWLKHLISLAQNEDWVIGEPNPKYHSWKRLEWVPAQGKVDDYIERLVSSRAFDDALYARKKFWSLLLEKHPFEFTDAHLPKFLYENRKEVDPSRLKRWSETWQEKLRHLNAEHLWYAPIPENRPPLPERFTGWEKMMGWWRECENNGTLGWHAIRDGIARQTQASPEMKTWVEKMDLDLHLPSATASNAASKLRL